MKNAVKLNFLFIVLLLSTTGLFRLTAQDAAPLTSAQQSVIVKEIMDLTDTWARNNINMDADKVIKFWDVSPDLRFAENGIFFANLDSMYAFLKGFYTNTTNMEVEWKERFVLPIRNDVACMSGIFRFKATFKSGDVFEGQTAFTALFIKKEGKWAVINGHESAVPNEK